MLRVDGAVSEIVPVPVCVTAVSDENASTFVTVNDDDCEVTASANANFAGTVVTTASDAVMFGVLDIVLASIVSSHVVFLQTELESGTLR